MMDMYEGIMTTRAIRRYSGESVSDEEVARCLAAAQQAPSGGNSQPWQYLVVTDFDLKVRVAWIYRTAYERWEKAQLSQLPPGWSDAQRQEFDRGLKASRTLAEGLESAAALVLFLMPDVSITPSDDEGPIDIGPLYASVYPAVQNFMLAARSLGIGTVLTTVWWSRQADMRELLGIPDRFEIVALVPLGRPVGRFGKAARRDAATVTHWNGYGSKRT